MSETSYTVTGVLLSVLGRMVPLSSSLSKGLIGVTVLLIIFYVDAAFIPGRLLLFKRNLGY